jgi:hypothetical protein
MLWDYEGLPMAEHILRLTWDPRLCDIIIKLKEVLNPNVEGR